MERLNFDNDEKSTLRDDKSNTAIANSHELL